MLYAIQTLEIEIARMQRAIRRLEAEPTPTVSSFERQEEKIRQLNMEILGLRDAISILESEMEKAPRPRTNSTSD